MNRIWIVARWEFLATVMRASFIGTVIALPLVHVGIAGLLTFAIRSAPIDDVAPKPVAVVDIRGVLAPNTAGRDVVYRNEEEAVLDLQQGRLDAVFVLADDYLESGRVRSYTRQTPGLFGFADNLARQKRAASVIRKGLLALSTPPVIARRAVEPTPKVEVVRSRSDWPAAAPHQCGDRDRQRRVRTELSAEPVHLHVVGTAAAVDGRGTPEPRP